MRKTIILLLIIVFPCMCYSQPRMRKIKVKDDIYLHSQTGFAFPKEINGFNRKGIVSFDKKNENVEANYVNGSKKVSLIVYPAHDGYEDRLRREFLITLQSIMTYENVEGQDFRIQCVSHQSGQHLIHGLSAKFNFRGHESLFSLYECGHWWMKFRITDGIQQESSLDSLERRLRDSLNPEVLINSKPLSDSVSLYFQKSAFRDSLMLGCVMGQAYAKLDWINNNLDSLEFQTGIPSSYLDYHLAGIDGALEFAQKHPNMKSSPATNSMLDFIIAVKKEGYLEEMFDENYMGCLIMPDNLILDTDGYHKWLKDHPFNRDLLRDNVIISNE